MSEYSSKRIFQTQAIKIKADLADSRCTNKNLFVSIPIVFKNDDTFKSLQASKMRIVNVKCQVMPKYNMNGFSGTLANTDNVGYVTGIFPVRINFQNVNYTGDDAIQQMSQVEIGGTNDVYESNRSAEFFFNGTSYLNQNDNATGVYQTFKVGQEIDTTPILAGTSTLTFGQVTIGIDKDSFIVPKAARNVEVGNQASGKQYREYAEEVSKRNRKDKKSSNPNDFVEEPIGGKLILDYYWTVNVQYDIQYARTSLAQAN